jgi:hypothetical protein
MYDRMVADRDIVPDRSSAFLKSAMDTGAVLHIYLVPDPDKIDIATDDRIEPETAVITGNNIPDNRRIRGDKTVIAKLRKFVFYGKNYSHGKGL